jgi:REP element-mobilizing transposase RayT
MRSRLFYHLVWTTRERHPLLDSAAAEFLQRYLRAVARQERARILAMGMVQTHVHVLFEAGTTTSLSRLVQRFKGGSSALINREGHTNGSNVVRWARGYAIHTVGMRGLRAARAYVENQGAHHPRERIASSSPPAP